MAYRQKASCLALVLAALWGGYAPAAEGLVKDSPALKNPLMDFDSLVFIRRYTYNSNHYYTEYINARWTPGGGLCVLDLKTGEVRELAPRLKGGVFMRFDVSFDAKKVVFDWKCDAQEGYRIYEVNVDGTGLRQLTFPPPNEAELIKSYRVGYHHGTIFRSQCTVFLLQYSEYSTLFAKPWVVAIE